MMKETLSASGGNEVVTEVWHFGSSRYRRVFNDVDLLLIYEDDADRRVVAAIRAQLGNAVSEEVGASADILALSRSEYCGLGQWLTGPADRIWMRADPVGQQDAGHQ
jgi:hypothetical protein